MSGILLSICITGRNDDYSPDFKRRLQQSINFLGYSAKKAGVIDLIEILLVDWNSNVPLYKELVFIEEASKILKHIVVSPRIAEKYNWGKTPFHTTISANAGLRRAAGKYVAIMQGDILIPTSTLKGVIELFQGKLKMFFEPSKSLMCIPRKLIPLSFNDAKEWSGKNEEVIDKSLFYMNPFLDHSPIGVGDIAGYGVQICTRENFYKIKGFDEKLGGWGGSDLDFSSRLSRISQVINLSSIGSFVYDFEITKQFNNKKYSRYNNIEEISFEVNAESWGLSQYDLEVVEQKNIEKINSTKKLFSDEKFLVNNNFCNDLKKRIKNKILSLRTNKSSNDIVRNRKVEFYNYHISGCSADLLLLELLIPKGVIVNCLDIYSVLSCRYLLSYLNPFVNLYLIPKLNEDKSLDYSYITKNLLDLRFHYGFIRCVPNILEQAVKSIKKFSKKNTKIFDIIRYNCTCFNKSDIAEFKNNVYEILSENGILIFYGSSNDSYNTFISELSRSNLAFSIIKWDSLYTGLLIKKAEGQIIVQDDELAIMIPKLLKLIQHRSFLFRLSKYIFAGLLKNSKKTTSFFRRKYEPLMYSSSLFLKIKKKVFYMLWKISLKMTCFLKQIYDFFIPTANVLD